MIIISSILEIEKMKGGYILTENDCLKLYSHSEIVVTTEELFRKLLLSFEGRADSFHGDSYGKVTIIRDEPK